MKIAAIIPARGGSTRLKRKNIYPVWGKPMLSWSIRACKASKSINDIYVSTEDSEIGRVATYFGAKVIQRPESLADNFTFKQHAIVHAAKNLTYKPDCVISIQANSPEMSAVDLDNAIEKFLKHNRSEIFSVDENLIQNAAFRIMKYEYVFQKSLSTCCGAYVTDYIDVHTLEDIEELEAQRSPSKHYGEENV